MVERIRPAEFQLNEANFLIPILILCGFLFYNEMIHAESYVVLRALVFFLVLFSMEITSLWSLCFSRICLFILHALLVVLSPSSLCWGLAAACDCGIP